MNETIENLIQILGTPKQARAAIAGRRGQVSFLAWYDNTYKQHVSHETPQNGTVREETEEPEETPPEAENVVSTGNETVVVQSGRKLGVSK